MRKFPEDEVEKSQIHDLSNVGEDGNREIKSEDLGISFKVPADYIDANPDELNLIHFESPKENSPAKITIGVYSKSEDVTSKNLAKEDKEHNSLYFNPDVCSVSGVAPYTATNCGDNSYYYWITTKKLYSGNFEFYDVFFEKGDYVYNVTIVVEAGRRDIYTLVMESLVVETLDSEKAGIFLRNNREYLKKTSSCSEWSVELQGGWEEYVAPSSAGAAYINAYTGAVLTFTITDGGDLKQKDMKEFIEELMKEIKNGGTRTEKLTQEDIGTKTYYTFQIYNEHEDIKTGIYRTFYIVLMRGDIYIFNLSETQETANTKATEDAKAIIKSFTLK